MLKIYWSIIIDFTKSVAQKSFWYLDTENSTANTNSGFEARRILTQANQNNGGGGAKSINDAYSIE